MSKKKSLGQFFTTNVDYILTGFEHTIIGKNITDPFAGGGDLLSWANKHNAKSIQGFDIDTSLTTNNITYNDSLTSIPPLEFCLTNPPYLGKNKMKPAQKSKYDMPYEDLYLLAIKKIMLANPNEGIIIIPVNFLSAENSDKLRTEFLNTYNITSINYFTEQVFADTTYNVIAFHYTKKTKPSNEQEIYITFYPTKEIKSFTLEAKYNYRIAGQELSKFITSKPLKIERLTESYMKKCPGNSEIRALFNDKNTAKEYRVNGSMRNMINRNIIVLNCIDTNANEEAWIKAEDIREIEDGYVCLVGKVSSRNIAYVLLPETVSVKQQEDIIHIFNREMLRLRRKYNSMFLTNFRDNNRKRVSFEFCYKLISFIYQSMI